MTFAIYGNSDRRTLFQSESEAMDEAKRLAAMFPGSTFHVMTAIATVRIDGKTKQITVDEAGKCDDCGARIVG